MCAIACIYTATTSSIIHNKGTFDNYAFGSEQKQSPNKISIYNINWNVYVVYYVSIKTCHRGQPQFTVTIVIRVLSCSEKALIVHVILWTFNDSTCRQLIEPAAVDWYRGHIGVEFNCLRHILAAINVAIMMILVHRFVEWEFNSKEEYPFHYEDLQSIRLLNKYEWNKTPVYDATYSYALLHAWILNRALGYFSIFTAQR